MQVKKFEAQSMKEALEMIKAQLGPDAIILSVRDHSAGFGLMGKKSIEVTAAISEKQAEKRKWAESRLNNDELLRLRRAPAKAQKQFIEKSVNRYIRPEPAIFQKAYDEQSYGRREATRTRYIDIPEETANYSAKVGTRVEDILKQINFKNDFMEPASPGSRVKMAAQSAYEAFEKVERTSPARTSPSAEVETLQSEISNLKRMIHELQLPKKQFVAPPQEIPFKDLQQKLTQSGLSSANVEELIQLAIRELPTQNHRPAQIEGWIVKQVLSEIQISDLSQVSPLQIFIGPRGHGKTSTLVKLAAHAVMKQNKRVAIFSADQNKVAAVEQLKTYAQILNVPFGLIRSPQDWELVQANLMNFDIIYVDFPGSSLREIEEISEIRRLLPPVQYKKDIHLVMSVATKDTDSFEFAERYHFCGYKDVIFTFLDESLNHGLIYNFQNKFGVPLHSFGVGSKLPEDFEFATKERVIDLIFKITKLTAANLLGGV